MNTDEEGEAEALTTKRREPRERRKGMVSKNKGNEVFENDWINGKLRCNYLQLFATTCKRCEGKGGAIGERGASAQSIVLFGAVCRRLVPFGMAEAKHGERISPNFFLNLT